MCTYMLLYRLRYDTIRYDIYLMQSTYQYIEVAVVTYVHLFANVLISFSACHIFKILTVVLRLPLYVNLFWLLAWLAGEEWAYCVFKQNSFFIYSDNDTSFTSFTQAHSSPAVFQHHIWFFSIINYRISSLSPYISLAGHVAVLALSIAKPGPDIYRRRRDSGLWRHSISVWSIGPSPGTLHGRPRGFLYLLKRG